MFPFLCSDGREDKLAALEEKWIYIHATGYGTKTTARYSSDLNKDFPMKYQAQITCSLSIHILPFTFSALGSLNSWVLEEHLLSVQVKIYKPPFKSK